MLFAFLYVLFFAFDILLATQFLVLGMMPMHFVVGGTGLFFIFFLIRRHHFFTVKRMGTLFPKIFWGYIVFITASNIFHATVRAFRSLGIISFDWFPPVFIIIVVSALLAVLAPFTLSMEHTLSRWLLFSLIAGVVRYGIEALFTLPVIVWRYLGVLDLVMLFSWLMMIVTMMRMEFSVEYKSPPGLSDQIRPFMFVFGATAWSGGTIGYVWSMILKVNNTDLLLFINFFVLSIAFLTVCCYAWRLKLKLKRSEMQPESAERS
jgi:hypothetical protein